MNSISRFVLVCSYLILGMVGCTSENHLDPEAQAQREKYLLKEEPAGPIGILEARQSGAKLTGEVVLLGRVKERVDGQSAFWINDPTADMHDDGEGHDHDNCPYCKAKKESGVDPTAIVKFVGAADETLMFNTKDVLGLEPGQMVVVKGKAELDDTIGLLTVRADGVYIRQ